MAKNFKRSYQVFSADAVTTHEEAVLSGEPVTVQRSVVSVQLVADGAPSITLNVPAGAAHPFEPGKSITVTFSAED